jgi:HTH-type transcriptional regulator, sugar sensing transcriptional regulator
MTDLIKDLSLLGIPGREAEIYIALLAKKEFTASEIAKITSISRTKTYDILQNLVKKGLCCESYKNGLKVYSSVEPQIVIDNILNGFEKKRQIAENLQLKLSALNTNSDEDIDYIEVMTEPGQVRERWLKIQDKTKSEMLVFVKPPYTGSLDDNIEKQENEYVIKKIRVKGIYEYNGMKSSGEIENFIKILELYEATGEEVKIVDILPMKLVISDESVAMFTLNDRFTLKSTLTTIIVDHPSFAAAMKKVFESYWQSGITIQELKKLKLF